MSRTHATLAKVIELIEPACVHAGLELVDVRLVMEPGGWVLRVCIDRPLPAEFDVTAVPPDRVDLSACEAMSRELSALLDVNDPIPQAYSLEVSSPGIDRPLRTAAHFARFAGAEAKIQLSHPFLTGAPGAAGERRNFRGVLGGVVERDGATLVRIRVDGHDFELPLDDVDSAKLVPDWDAVMRGQSGVGPKPAKSPDKAPTKSPKKGGRDAARS